MKLFFGLLALTSAAAIAAVAALFSLTGLAAIFAASYWPIIAMGAVLENGKLVAASWLHANWSNPRVSWFHKGYLSAAILALMLITAIGIYGYLAKGHLDQEVPLGTANLQIAQRQQQIDTDRANITRLTDRQAQLDAAVNSLIQQNFVVRSQSIRAQQKAEREQIAGDLLTAQHDVDRLSQEMLPLKMQTNDVEAKLGPVKYVADLFGWTDRDAAVRMIILILMVAFDPLAISLVLAGSISVQEWIEQRSGPNEAKQEEPLSSAFLSVPPIIHSTYPVDPESDKQAILAMLRRNPSVVEDVIDSVLEWHEQHR